ncbi:MAG: hypothetical protein M1814_002503 [Vezdaea aestivalis]|nr:MAG: hypothetical protein M1814_002503 [Vezdaea aestivalis]
MPENDLRLLSLDGGGVRGLSSLIILKRLMETINPEAPPKPCEYFDMIGGTSAGGIIALMLGRLEMDIDECIHAFVSLSERVFKKKHFPIRINGRVRGKFGTGELEKCIKEIVRQKLPEGDNALLKGPIDQKCKVFVCAVSQETSHPVLFTSYPSRGSSDLFESTKIWEACRATSAATTFFDPIKIGTSGESFVDGAIGNDNPVEELWSEARQVWSDGPFEKKVKCLVSIGTGCEPATSFGLNAVEIAMTLQRKVTESEDTANAFHRSHPELDDGNRYFRFNVTHGLESVSFEDATQTNKITAATNHYVALPHIIQDMNLSAQKYRVPFSVKGLPLVRRFVARSEEMEFLNRNLLPSSSPESRRKVAVIHGLGGSGKTQLAIEFARSTQKQFSSTFWLNGESKASICQSLVDLAQELPHDQIPDFCKDTTSRSPEIDKQVIRHVLRWFSQPENSKWLLIYDNVNRDNSPEMNDPQSYAVEDFFPGTDHGAILITSRLRAMQEHGNDLSIGNMSEHQGVKLLEDRIGRSLDGLERIVELVDGLPLALAQAGCYINGTTTSVDEYTALYRENWSTLFSGNTSRRLKDYPRSILSTYTISYNHIERKDADAARLLDPFSFFDNTDLWYSLFEPSLSTELLLKYIAPEWFLRSIRNEAVFKEKIQILLDFSLIQTRYISSSYTIHPIVHDWCLYTNVKKNSPIDLLAVYTVASACKLANASTTWTIKERVVRHSNRCHKTDACTIQRFTLERQERILGPRDTTTLLTLDYLGSFLSILGENEEARSIYWRILRAFDETFSLDHPTALKAMAELGKNYCEVGDYTTAEIFYNYLLGVHGKTSVSDETLSFAPGRSLDIALIQQESILVDDEFERCKRSLNTTDQIILFTFTQLASLKYRQGKLEEAKIICNLILTKSEAILGPSAPQTLDVVRLLGQVNVRQRNYADAWAMFDRARKGCEKVLGPSHPATIDTVFTQGVLHYHQSQWAEAAQLFHDALEGCEKHLGLKLEMKIRCLSFLGFVYHEQGRYTEAISIFQRTIAGSEKTLGLDHASTLLSAHMLGVSFLVANRYTEAVASFQRALQSHERTLGPDHKATLQSRKLLQVANKGLLRSTQETREVEETVPAQTDAALRVVSPSEAPNEMVKKRKRDLVRGLFKRNEPSKTSLVAMSALGHSELDGPSRL